MVQLGIACITAYEGCFDLILTRSTTLIVLNGKSEGAGVAKLKQVVFADSTRRSSTAQTSKLNNHA